MLATIASIIAIAGFALSAGLSINSSIREFKNTELRDDIRKAATAVAEALKSGRLDASRLLAALQSNNSIAMQQMLMSNPLVSKTMEEINADAKKLSDLQSELNNVENRIADLQAQLSTLGYATNSLKQGSERDQANAIAQNIKGAVAEHGQIVDKIKNTKITPYRDFKVDTSHLDAISQNVQGGTTNA